MKDELLSRYNYDHFVPENFEPWMRFAESPAVGEPVADFPLWRLDESKTTLHTVLRKHRFTVVEFGSFT